MGETPIKNKVETKAEPTIHVSLSNKPTSTPDNKQPTTTPTPEIENPSELPLSSPKILPALPQVVDDLPVVDHDDISNVGYPPKPPSTSSLSSLSSSDPENDDNDDEFSPQDINHSIVSEELNELLDTSMPDMNTSDLSDPDSEAETEQLGEPELHELDLLEEEHRRTTMNLLPLIDAKSHHSSDLDDTNSPPPTENNIASDVEDENDTKVKGESTPTEPLTDTKDKAAQILPSKKRRHSLTENSLSINNSDEFESIKLQAKKQKSTSPNTLFCISPHPKNPSTPQSLPLQGPSPSVNSQPDDTTNPVDDDASNIISETLSPKADSCKSPKPDKLAEEVPATDADTLLVKEAPLKNESTDNKALDPASPSLVTETTKQRCSTPKSKKTTQSTDEEGAASTMNPTPSADKQDSRTSESVKERTSNDLMNSGDKDDGSCSESENFKVTKKKLSDEEIQAAQQAERKEALMMLTDIEVEFAKLRDQLDNNKMARYVAEIEMCAEGTHPDLEKACSDIQSVQHERIRRAELRRKYQRICIDIQTRASREHLHQQFMKDRSDIRTKLLSKTTEEWYQVNRERRLMDSMVPEFGFRPPLDRLSQHRELESYNSQVTLFSDIHKAYGFPAAPEMKPSTDEEIEEDFRLFALGANRNHEFYYYGANGSGDMGPEVGNKISTALPASTFGMVPLQANGHHSARHGNHYVAHHYHHH